jgi:hypothetical protein
MSTLRKDDPVYYKTAVNKLIKQAKDNGLEVGFILSGNGNGNYHQVEVSFKNDIGEMACATVYGGRKKREE